MPSWQALTFSSLLLARIQRGIPSTPQQSSHAWPPMGADYPGRQVSSVPTWKLVTFLGPEVARNSLLHPAMPWMCHKSTVDKVLLNVRVMNRVNIWVYPLGVPKLRIGKRPSKIPKQVIRTPYSL
ncbi:hypothetical protein K469DRAFT_214319 [Zopfia rhizophila CBS 207.26]|uniref:Secreted protein n=1 Tax=Zopfia rhizophila CBS 207.26 TaxID=1314779 RepID=A0A6A6DY09_9PEZI|nr:hypothetical protein K469DRAFT_214319 [Zopfia rhizophila CBS 207.26]